VRAWQSIELFQTFRKQQAGCLLYASDSRMGGKVFGYRARRHHFCYFHPTIKFLTEIFANATAQAWSVVYSC
jgi:hypothetical protein